MLVATGYDRKHGHVVTVFSEHIRTNLHGMAELHMANLAESGIGQSAISQSVRILLNGGKRLRPYLAWLGYMTGGGEAHP